MFIRCAPKQCTTSFLYGQIHPNYVTHLCNPPFSPIVKVEVLQAKILLLFAREFYNISMQLDRQ